MSEFDPAKPLHTGSTRRWYDQEASCRQILEHLQRIPQEEVRDFSADLIAQLAEQIQQWIRNRSGTAPRTLGLAGIKEIYLSKSNNRRWYDQQPKLKQAIGSFYLLPVEGLSALCFKLQEPIAFLSLYSFVCDQLGQTPRTEDLNGIARICLFQGKAQTESYISDLVGKDLFEALMNEFV